MPESHIHPDRLHRLISDYIDRRDTQPWSAADLAWDQLDAARVTPAQRSAVRFVTLIEDHIPGYLADLLAHFPVDGSVSPAQYRHNRAAFRFFVRWAQDEDRHAEVFCRYQLAAGIQDEASLQTELVREGRKTWRFPRDLPVQVFTYTVIQEKATQLYYQMLARAVDEPVLRSLLHRVQKDEARHFAIYADILAAYVDELGPATLPAIQEVLQAFKMPLAEQLDNYWRWSLEISDTAGGYDYTTAFEDLVRVVHRSADAARSSHALTSWVEAVRAG
jgi:rubrerythrin